MMTAERVCQHGKGPDCPDCALATLNDILDVRVTCAYCGQLADPTDFACERCGFIAKRAG